MLLSLFCGAGGLDLGFEQAGFQVGLAFDKRKDSVRSYNHNRVGPERAHCRDVSTLSLHTLDELWGSEFRPAGLIGGPPCQSFSQANRSITEDDPRHTLPLVYAGLLKSLNMRSPVSFFVMENVKGLTSGLHSHRLKVFKKALSTAGFHVSEQILNAADYETPQNRHRLFLVGLNRDLYGSSAWAKPQGTTADRSDVSVRSVLHGLPEPTWFSKQADPGTMPHHPNHWCMTPRSKRFTTPGDLTPGDCRHRSFKTLSWDKPSITVAYGHREVHVHPNCHRRLSVYEAMRLQGFPHEYQLLGTLSSQIDQVSEAVPPPMAEAVARSVAQLIAQSANSEAA